MPIEEEESSDSASSSEEEEEQEQGRKGATMASPPPSRSSNARGGSKVATVVPTADSSEDEEEEDEEDEEDDEDDGSDDDEDEDEPVKSQPETPAGSRKASQSKAASVSAKPLNSKPMDSKTVKLPASTSQAKSKRPPDTSTADDSRRKKKKGNGEEEKTESADGGSKTEEKASPIKAPQDQKKLFQRVWEEEDEIELLKTLLDYLHRDAGSLQDMNAFFEFSRKKLEKFKKTQLMDKVRKLRKRYANNIAKEHKNGKSPVFKTPHEAETFLISKEIWGETTKEVKGKDSNKKVTTSPRKGGSAIVKKSENGSEGEKSLNGKAKIPARTHGGLDASVPKDENNVEFFKSFEVSVGGTRLEDRGNSLWDLNEVVERWIKLAEPSKLKDLEQKQGKLEGRILEVHLERLEVAAGRAKLALEAFKAAKQLGGK